MPALPRNTYRTSYGFHFRLVVPEPLRAILGKREIKHSLGKDYRTAVSQARILAVQADQQIEAARAKLAQEREQQDAIDAYLAQSPDRRQKSITRVTPELAAMVRSFWLSGLDTEQAIRNEGLDDEEFEERGANIVQMKQMIAEALARGNPDPFIPPIRDLLSLRGYRLSLPPEIERQFVLDVIPAIQQGYDILEQRQAGRHAPTPVLETPSVPLAINNSGRA